MNINETIFSQKVHTQGVPLLLSADLLRSRGLGQVDLATYDPHMKVISLFEVKSSAFGVESMSYIQDNRLRLTQVFLSSLFGLTVKLQKINPE